MYIYLQTIIKMTVLKNCHINFQKNVNIWPRFNIIKSLHLVYVSPYHQVAQVTVSISEIKTSFLQTQ